MQDVFYSEWDEAYEAYQEANGARLCKDAEDADELRRISEDNITDWANETHDLMLTTYAHRIHWMPEPIGHYIKRSEMVCFRWGWPAHTIVKKKGDAPKGNHLKCCRKHGREYYQACAVDPISNPGIEDLLYEYDLLYRWDTEDWI